MNYETSVNGHTLEYFDDEHIYLVDGIIVSSITQILSKRFKGKYDKVDKDVLIRASAAGTRVHEAIEHYAKTGERLDIPEVRGFEFLQRQYKFKVLESEIPVILSHDGAPVAAGRLDLVLQIGDQIGGADIKRTSVLDKEYLALQLNLYRIAYRQSYGTEWTFLRGIHLRNDTRKFVTIPINEDMTIKFLEEYINEQGDTDRPHDGQH